MKSGKHTLLRKFSTFAVVVSHSLGWHTGSIRTADRSCNKLSGRIINWVKERLILQYTVN